MLFILTGDIQIGKTRWLLSTVDKLSALGAVCSGVIAPGDWVEDGEGGFEKLGIDNLLLPERRLLHFARRRDLAKAEGVFDEESHSAKAGLKWEISEKALAEVNAHFEKLSMGDGEFGSFGNAAAPELLIVDEFGQLELKRGEGLVSALRLVGKGAPSNKESDLFSKGYAHPKHCLVIVRRDLFDLAAEKFGEKWGGVAAIMPDNESGHLLKSALFFC